MAINSSRARIFSKAIYIYLVYTHPRRESNSRNFWQHLYYPHRPLSTRKYINEPMAPYSQISPKIRPLNASKIQPWSCRFILTNRSVHFQITKEVYSLQNFFIRHRSSFLHLLSPLFLKKPPCKAPDTSSLDSRLLVYVPSIR